MQSSIAKSKNVRVSPYKLRPYADFVRGKLFVEAIAYLKAHESKRIRPIIKALLSAFANMKVKLGEAKDNDKLLVSLYVKSVRVDEGPALKYYKPSAMGRASVQRKRLSHITVVLENVGLEKKAEER